jgi:GATA-binding protein
MPRRAKAIDALAANHNSHDHPRSGMSTAHYKGSRGVPANSASTLADHHNTRTKNYDHELNRSAHAGDPSPPLNTNVIPPIAATPHTLQQPQQQQQPPTSDTIASNRTRGKLDPSSRNHDPRKELLREAFFPDWRDDAASADLKPPEEMQKQDPLATQIWKLYSKTKTQLPNHERMENLTWRMMAMSLKRKEREQARYVLHRPSPGARGTPAVTDIGTSV